MVFQIPNRLPEIVDPHRVDPHRVDPQSYEGNVIDQIKKRYVFSGYEGNIIDPQRVDPQRVDPRDSYKSGCLWSFAVRV